MDIAALAVLNSQAIMQNQASLLVMKKALDISEQSSQGMIQMVSASPAPVLPHLGNSVDIKI